MKDILCFFNSGGVAMSRKPQHPVEGLPNHVFITFEDDITPELVKQDMLDCPARWRAVASVLYGEPVESVRALDGLPHEISCDREEVIGVTKPSTAYIVGEHDAPPGLPEGQKWHLLRLAMKLMGKVEGESPLPDKGVLPSFYMVATDREAAKAEICAKIDEMFDAQAEPQEMMYLNVCAWVDAIRAHRCLAKHIVSDNQVVIKLGYSCTGCGTWFGLRVTDFKTTIGDFGVGAEELKMALQTKAGRVALQESMNKQ